MKRLSTLVAAPFVVAACTYLPDPCNEQRYDDAVGSVTISSPLFTPLDALPGDSRRLSFGDLADEQSLAAWISQPVVSLSEARYSGTELALITELAGSSISNTDTFTESLQNAQVERTLERQRERTLETPDVPGAVDSAGLSTPTEVREALVKLLERSQGTYRLSPDQVASLVAAYKTYMVNLEDYFNVAGIDYENGHLSEFVPYKVHFTVTAEPGHYTRYHQFDAVAELTFGSSPDDVRVLTVSPLETSQTLDQFRATLDSLKSSLEVSGQGGPVAARGSIKRIDELARRLEGLRENKTLVVGFPESNKIRIRFRPSVVPTDEEQDLQPRSRVLTAIVLVKNECAGKCALAAGKKWSRFALEEKGTEAEVLQHIEASTTEKVTRLTQKLNMLLPSVDSISLTRSQKEAIKSATGIDLITEPNSLPTLDLTSLNAEQLHEVENLNWGSNDIRDTIRDLVRAMHQPKPSVASISRLNERRIEVRQSCYFAAGLRDRSGEFSPPRGVPGDDHWLRWFISKPVDRIHPRHASRTQSVTVPIWRGRWGQSLHIDRAFGHYHLDGAETIVLDSTRIGFLREALSDMKEKDDATPYIALEEKFDARIKNVGILIAAISQTKVTAVVRITAPPGVLLETQDDSTFPLETWTWARVRGVGEATPEWQRIGTGSGEAVLEVEGVDASDAIRIDERGRVTFGEVNAFVEVVMVDRGVEPDTDTAADSNSAFSERIRQRRIREFALQPRIDFALSDTLMTMMRDTTQGSSTTSRDGPSPNSNNSNRIQLDLDSVQIELGGRRATTTEPRPDRRDAPGDRDLEAPRD